MLLKTTGIQYDDRVRKECGTIRKLGWDVQVSVLETANLRYEESSANGVSIRAISLLSRKALPQARGLVIKTIEMYVQFLRHVLRVRPDVVWLHNQEMAGVLPVVALLRRARLVRRIVWDQHELPPETALTPSALRWLWARLMRACDAVIVANQERCELILGDAVRPSERDRLHVLENLCDSEFLTLPRGRPPVEIRKWLNGNAYFLAQGGGAPGRKLGPLVRAVLALDGPRLLVVGPFDPEERERLSTELGSDFEDRVYFTGMIPQMQLVDYIDEALASCVFYAGARANQWLCAPNRMFQALARGTAVVVGSNPPMRRVVEAWGCGVAVPGDGSDSRAIETALRQVLARIEEMKAAARATIGSMTWEDQARVVEQALTD